MVVEGIASDMAGDCNSDWRELSAASPEVEADDSKGLGPDTEACVKLGEEVACSCTEA